MRLAHVGWNIAGLSLPLCIAAITVPQLLEKLGHERFGLLALAWGLVGYASALDLGIGRALTQQCSKLRGERRLDDVPDLLATATLITLFTGLAGALAIVILALISDRNWVGATSTTTVEIKISILLLAIALPAQAISATYRGVNEAFLNFKNINLLRVFLGAVNFAGPYLMSYMTTSLHFLVLTLVVSRVAALYFFRNFAYRCLADHEIKTVQGKYSKDAAKTLFSFGAWMTVSSVISPVLVQADRFVIASVISATAVSAYVLPYEVVVQTLILVGAVSSVMFPQLSRMIQENQNGWQTYFWSCLKKVALTMSVVCTLVFLFIPYFLPWWIGKSINGDSLLVGKILCFGVFANSISAMFFSLLHAFGKTKLTAKIHLIELPVFLLALVSLTTNYGVMGAAVAWVGRMIFDGLVMAVGARNLFPNYVPLKTRYAE